MIGNDRRGRKLQKRDGDEPAREPPRAWGGRGRAVTVAARPGAPVGVGLEVAAAAVGRPRPVESNLGVPEKRHTSCAFPFADHVP